MLPLRKAILFSICLCIFHESSHPILSEEYSNPSLSAHVIINFPVGFGELWIPSLGGTSVISAEAPDNFTIEAYSAEGLSMTLVTFTVYLYETIRSLSSVASPSASSISLVTSIGA